MKQWGWWLVLWWVVPTLSAAGVVVSTFSAQDAIDKLEFNHLTVDEHTGRVYVGAVNRLYQLVSDLELVQEVETGPSLDSPECSFIECPATAEKKLTDNVNKALVIDRSQGKLISCGSLSQGVCTVRSLENIKHDLRKVQEPVVANNATASTVAFIAPGPSDQTRGNPLVLYVGVTYTGNSYYRAEVPAVSSRSLNPDNTFQLARTAVTTGTRMFVNSLSREKYPIHYIFGFSHEGFSYFLTIQMKFSNGGPSQYISKLVRVCQNDPDYYSYTEIPLECKDREGEHYSLVQAAYMGRPGSNLASELGITAQDEALFAVFSKPSEEYSSQPMASSGLCIYSLKIIRRMFLQNIQKCFNGEANRGLDFISPAQKCTATKLTTIDETFCGMDVNSPLGGEVPALGIAAMTWSEHLTAIAATSTSEYTVVFLGTANGHLKKVVVQSGRSANEYSDAAIDEGSSVNADLRFDRKHMHLYVMTERKVSKVKVQECEVYSKCSGCLGAKDPYCGWCSLENKCSLLSNCRDAASDPLYWISYKDGRCTTITSVAPKQLQRTTARTLQLEIENLPSTLKGEFQCAFTAMGKTLLTKANRDKSTISCYTPRTDLLPNILHEQHHFTAILSVRLKDEHDFVATNFTFFDCNTYSSCTDCVSSDFPCDWCVDGHRCTHDTAENCRNDILVTGVSRIGPSIRSGPGYCPRINSTSEGGTEILVAWGSTQKIKVRVDNIADILILRKPRKTTYVDDMGNQFIVQTRFGCQFNIEGRVSIKEALLVGDIIYCEEMTFTYNSPRPNITATFAVIWGNSKPLDNPDNIHVLIYRCREMADNCGICLALPEKYGCGWCQSSSRCEVNDQCEQGEGVWLDRAETCPNPEVTHFYPKYGPWEGGTNITIVGINLGKTFDDIYEGIMVAGIHCQPYRDSYIQTRQITCKLDGPGSKNENKKGPVIVKVRDFRGQSVEEFRFVDPRITDIKPTFGPKSGGTRLTLYGEHMNAGSSITASIHSKPCRIITTNATHAECITSMSDELINGTVKMMFDQGRRELEGKSYAYVSDPEIRAVMSGPETGVQGPKGIPAGGIHITVKGTNLNSIQNPRMMVYMANSNGENINYTSHCLVETARIMKCLSPRMNTEQLELDPNNPKRLRYGFIMDDVKSVTDHTKMSHSFFFLYPNPVYNKFPEETKYYKSDYLTINGEDLARASQALDVKVYIGTEMCNVTSLSMSQLTCRPPTEQPPAMTKEGKADSSKIPEVRVVVGENLSFDIGYLSYTGPGDGGGKLPKSVIIPLTVGGGLLLLVVIGILIAYRHKSTESSRVLRSMQEQMDVLEMKVAAECKEAFAELQTEMTDLTSDLMLGGIPFLDYSTYTMKILFPRIEDHPVLRRDFAHPDFSRRDRERGIKLFNQLILNKTFLLNFIRTLESNRYFSMKDRVNVASLIMVTLQSKMEYCTDILKTLLAELIEKCMDGKSHPKLLLRRTESVAEKMLSAWFTFLLYKFLRECAGEPLFLLYRAIKTQVEKGPVDCVTCEGRYSLSEEKLIRQSLDFKRLTVRVSMAPNTVYSSGLDPHAEHTDVPVKVLDCDTVSQVKEKSLDTIYRNTPFSQRPPRDDLDLEWRTGMTGRIILSDEDSTTKTDNGWRKLNTLFHYKVPDQANLTLLPKQSSMYNLSILSERMYDPKHQHKYETLNFSKMGSGSPPPSRATSPLNHDGIGESGIRTWHLVRHHDDQNQKEGDRRDKMVSEIYLTRLLTTKGTLQEFVNDLFETIFSVAYRGSALPLAIKYMFDFLDDQALHHAITDPEVVHTWKSNSLPLRFWVNLIKNPEFVFDIHKSNIVDSSLSVIAQTFMDSCSTSDHRLGKDSPSSKLLYARDIPKFKSYVESYYAEIKQMPAISDQDMNAMLAEESRVHTSEFNTIASVWELFTYASKYNEQLMSALEEDEFSKRQRLAYKLEQVLNLMAEDTNA